jgi:phenylacetate-CoA ligase
LRPGKESSVTSRDALKPWLSWLPYGVKQGGEYRAWSQFLKDAEGWPRERIERWQMDRLRTVMRDAIDHTEGYRELYRKAGARPEDVQAPADVRHLPMVTKRMLQENLDAFTVTTRGAKYMTTGGSTGIPFGFHIARSAEQREAAFIHAGWRRVGWDSRMPIAVLRGAFIGSRDEIWRYDRFWNSLLLTSYYLTARTLPIYIEMLERHHIEVLHAYPSSYLLFCDLLAESGLKLRPAPKLAMVGSENLYDWQLTRYAEVLPDTRVFSWYGQAEMVVQAPWCGHSKRLHAWPFYGYTEVLDKQGCPVGEGEEGEIVGTSLHLRATPFIRYRTMDVGVKGPEQCPDCQRPYLMLENVKGRLQEVIVTASGRYISMTMINFHDDIFDRLRQFQFLQDTPGKLLFRYVPKSALSPDEEGRIRQGLMEKLGDDVELQMRETDTITLTAHGKLRFLDQRLPIKYGDR